MVQAVRLLQVLVRVDELIELRVRGLGDSRTILEHLAAARFPATMGTAGFEPATSRV
jgi:hypothetical protein